ncbi:tyrosine-type recombinase/integrase [Scytonema sp. UIC 10036]|uniref:tyrosine-type recombinase/integrase n=1 Tax=Scytonema sp. UIC 10036 TaxID=2304196 RepID=UPI0012DACA3F|nr:site-specific integrase [Scytonema sp. UIC 10036]MUG91613.1 tyrosine-type recombinase/integrase [Scytonema sp. UIC 10036]
MSSINLDAVVSAHLIQNQSTQKLLNNPLLLLDCWSLDSDLCLKAPFHRKFSLLNFAEYSQDWLKIVVKLYILLRVNNGTSAATIQRDVYNLQKFDLVLKEQYVYSFEQINNGIFESFDYYLRSKNLKEVTIHRYYATLVAFFDTCRLEGWFDVSTYWFKGRRRRFYPSNDEINYIPEEVWNQLESNLHHLPEPIQRMILVIRTTGMRVGELLNMPYDCLRKRGSQWRIRITTEKYGIEDELPIPEDLAVVIKEQQLYIIQVFSEHYNHLFCTSKAGGWKTLTKKSDGTVLDEMVFEAYPEIMPNHLFNMTVKPTG